MTTATKRKRGRPKLTPEQKLERQKAKIAAMAEKKKKKVVKKPKSQDAENNNQTVTKTTTFLLTPAGRCPIELHGNDKEAIAIWASYARNETRNSVVHTFESLSYWLRDFFDIFSEEYKVAKSNLKEVCEEFQIRDMSKVYSKLPEEDSDELSHEM